MRQLIKPVILWFMGGLTYIVIELIYRGYSHWSMFILGGVCFLAIGYINELFTWEMSLLYQALIGTGITTLLEFITGCIVNIALKWNVWDYSNMPGNILGQICFQFILIWFFLVIIAIILDDWLRYLLFNEEKPHYHII